MAIGTVPEAVTPLPRRPALLLPQHQIVDADMAHAKSEPVVTTCADATLSTVTGPVSAGDPASPFPILPFVLSPKQATAPVERSTQVKYVPAEMPAALEIGETDPGLATTAAPIVSLADETLFPISLYMLEPQQYAPPVDVTAHEWEFPADTDTAFDSKA